MGALEWIFGVSPVLFGRRLILGGLAFPVLYQIPLLPQPLEKAFGLITTKPAQLSALPGIAALLAL